MGRLTLPPRITPPTPAPAEWRFDLPSPEGGGTDIVALSHNGFAVGNGEDFLALEKAAAATNPSQPHPWPIEAFLGAHPLALKFVQETQVIPASYGTQAFFSNDALIFVNKAGAKQPGRYKILPVAGLHNLSDAEAKTKSADFLSEAMPRSFGLRIAGQSTSARSAS